MGARLLHKQTNGLLLYDEDYDAPDIPQNYIMVDNNPYILKPILLSCVFREYKTTYIAKCGCKHSKMYCNHFKTNVNVLKCVNCTINTNGQTVETGGKGC